MFTFYLVTVWLYVSSSQLWVSLALLSSRLTHTNFLPHCFMWLSSHVQCWLWSGLFSVGLVTLHLDITLLGCIYPSSFMCYTSVIQSFCSCNFTHSYDELPVFMSILFHHSSDVCIKFVFNIRCTMPLPSALLSLQSPHSPHLSFPPISLHTNYQETVSPFSLLLYRSMCLV